VIYDYSFIENELLRGMREWNQAHDLSITPRFSFGGAGVRNETEPMGQYSTLQIYSRIVRLKCTFWVTSISIAPSIIVDNPF
jgi:hypothetical protein